MQTEELNEVFDFIIEYKRQNDGNAPTVRKIAEALEANLSDVHALLRELHRRGRIQRVAGTRTIIVPNGRWVFEGK